MRSYVLLETFHFEDGLFCSHTITHLIWSRGGLSSNKSLIGLGILKSAIKIHFYLGRNASCKSYFYKLQSISLFFVYEGCSESKFYPGLVERDEESGLRCFVSSSSSLSIHMYQNKDRIVFGLSLILLSFKSCAAMKISA